MGRTDEEATKTSGNSFRSLLDELEVACKFYGADEVLSAANKLLAHSKYDTYRGYIRLAPELPLEEICESSNPGVVYVRLNSERFHKPTTAMVTMTCGHCGQLCDAQTATASGHSDNIQFVLDNFPEEL